MHPALRTSRSLREAFLIAAFATPLVTLGACRSTAATSEPEPGSVRQ